MFYSKTLLIPDDPVTTPDELCYVSRKTITDQAGVIEAPGLTDENYPSRAECKWIIQVDKLTYSQVESKFLSFDVMDR